MEIATEAIILAGGLGTRLRSTVPDLPKPMAPVGARPFLAHVLDQLVQAGFESVVLAVGFRHEAIRAHFGDGYRNLVLRYSVESEPLGTGGAIRLACGQVSGEEVFVLNGDTYLRADYRAMLDAHTSAAARLTIAACHVQDVARYGALEIEGGIVRGFREKGSSGPGWINAGTYVLGRALRESLPKAGAFSFEQDVLVPEVGILRPLVFEADGPLIDIGVPDDYARAQEVLGGVQGGTL
ncbi:MAG TPA: D-glycero-D-manno-heptose 1-phosphate guanosyltransferase [Rhodocyclaceae bacterium]|nr:MAG: D-glycero-D-manno-heptose 1-phosphate guanosyltransferase [Betaproteobacteria bacterium CG2_30_68_42]HCX34360.1 D-glycero-D-manno-heptose 1-phosphate guanosyltransferase [Rhodocyclaceae bacterium]